MAVTALILTNTQTSALGLPASLDAQFAGSTVLHHTVRRAAMIPQVDKIVLIHAPGQNPLSLIDTAGIDKPITTHMDPGCLADANTLRWASARKWAQPNWRGGLGGASCFDELTPIGPLADALAASRGEAGFIVRGDWCLFDPKLAEQQLKLLLQDVKAMKMIFSQAPPGLGGIAVGPELLKQLVEGESSFGDVLAYKPQSPQIDPVGRDVNCPIPAPVRDCAQRFIYDTPRSITLLNKLADHLGDKLNDADAATITNTYRAIEKADPQMAYRYLPRLLSLELTPRREAVGPITPQHHVTIDRPDMDTDLALRLIEQIGEAEAGGDIALLLGGLGDAMLHPDWERIVQAAHNAGILGIGIETDLLCEPEELEKLLTLPLDMVTVRVNADTGETYKKVMGTDGYKRVLDNLQWLFNQRFKQGDQDHTPRGKAKLPWLVPSMVKTVETLPEMESFFDKWTHYMGHAWIKPACSGCGLMPAMSPVPMQPPDRQPCRQIDKRMTILSNGMVAQCDQDWLGRSPIGDTRTKTLIAIWQDTQQLAQAHQQQRWETLTLCGECVEWHRP